MTDQDNYSDIQQEVPADADMERDLENVYRGHKATISNPRKFIKPFTPWLRPEFLHRYFPGTSQAAKEHARQVLENETGESVDDSNNIRGVTEDNSREEPKNPANV